MSLVIEDQLQGRDDPDATYDKYIKYEKMVFDYTRVSCHLFEASAKILLEARRFFTWRKKSKRIAVPA